jgi:CubicO group peptidase (beta-lactamase class C family)
MILNIKFKKLIGSFILVLCLPLFLHCETGQNHQAGTNTTLRPDISGCWKGKPMNQFGDRSEELRLISLKPDGRPAITLIYEVGPRSRVWEYDIDITCQDSLISWEAHTGHLNVTNDTMTVLKEWKGERTNWIFTRYQAGDDFMRQLDSTRSKEYTYQVPDSLDDGWKCADLVTVGVDSEKIVQFIERIANGKHGDMHSILIVKDGKLVLEEYFATQGKRYGPFIKKIFREKPHHLASTTKGVLSTLTGIAIDQGFIQNVEALIYQYFPDYASSLTEEKIAIKVRDLLTMTAGWEWDQFKYSLEDPRNNGTAMWRCEDVIKYVLERPLDAKPGEKFNYTNGVPTVMGVVLKNACGMEVPQFAEQNLFHPLGISNYLWTRYLDGTLETDGGLALRARDLAKIGQLFLNNGNWQGKQIVSQNWVLESTKKRINFDRFWGWSYGYYWMQVDVNIDDRKIHSYFVPGDGGQLLAVFPDLKMVIVLTAGNYGTDVKSVCFAMIRKYILPALLFEKEN